MCMYVAAVLCLGDRVHRVHVLRECAAVPGVRVGAGAAARHPAHIAPTALLQLGHRRPRLVLLHQDHHMPHLHLLQIPGIRT